MELVVVNDSEFNYNFQLYDKGHLEDSYLKDVDQRQLANLPVPINHFT
jgi:hypothetical protein